ncbi:MAG: ribokinase [Clostridia bacterium]|nr:ribokinase [Clostridia bacterium]
MTHRPKAAVVGSCNADLTVYTEKVPVNGETVSGTRLVIGPGGKGSNQATALSRAGAETSIICRMGCDSLASVLEAHYASEGISACAVIRDSASQTGSATIIVDELTGDNRIVVVPGANGDLCPADVEAHSDLIASCDILLLQLESPIEASIYAARLARKSGAKVILNPAPAKEIPAELISLCNYIIPNETEAETLTGIAIHSAEDAFRAGKALIALGAENAIITLGKAGCAAVTPDEEFTVPAFSVKAVDTTAAGDQFCGAFAAELALGAGLMQALKFATAASAVSVTRAGASVSMASREEIEEFISKNK